MRDDEGGAGVGARGGADAESALRVLHGASIRLAAGGSVDSFCAHVVGAVRGCTGFDRVVVIRSGGAVIAEARGEEREPGSRSRAVVEARIVRDGRPWGILECHHREPRVATGAESAMTSALAELIAVQVARSESHEREQAEAALRVERDQAQRYLDTADSIIVSLDREGRIRMINRQGQLILGRDEASLLGQNWFELCLPQPEGMELVLPVFEAVVRGEMAAVDHFENAVVNARGERRTIAWRNSRIVDESGRFVGTLSCGLDITERKRAEEALRESEARFRRMADATPVLIWMADPRGGCTYFNRPWLEFTGRSAAEEAGEGWTLGVHPDDLAGCLAGRREAFERGARFQMEYRLRRHDGEYRWFMDSGAPLHAADGELQGAIGSCVDITERRESEERFRTVAENLPDGLYVLDPNDTEEPLRVLYANPAAGATDGYSVDELLGRSIVRLLDAPGTAEEAEERTVRIMRGEVVTFDAAHRHRLGHLVPLEVRALQILWQGRTAILGINRDLTERKRHEAVLAEAAQRLTLALEGGQMGVWDWDIASGRIVWDANHARLFGMELGDFDGTYAGFARRIHADDRRALEAALEAALERDEAYHPEFRVVLPDGTTRWLAASGRIRRDAAGRPVRALGVVRDVTARRQAEEALRASNRQYQLLAGAMQDTVGLVAADGRFVYVSPSVQRLTGFTAEELVGADSRDWVAAAEHPRARGALEEALAGREVCVQGHVLHRDGRQIATESNLTPMRDEAGRITGVVFCTRDISTRRQAEEALQEAHRRHEDLVATIDGIVWEADAQTFQFKFVSRAAERLLGYPPERWLEPDFWREHIHPDDRDSALGYCRDCVQVGVNHQFEYRMIASDGRVVWLRDAVTVIGSEGAPLLLRGVMIDITDRKRIEESERRLHERLGLAAEAGQIGVWELDLVQDRVVWDDRMLRIYRIDRADCPASAADWERRVHPEDRARLRVSGQALVEGQSQAEVECRILWPSGELRHIRSFAKLVRDAGGAPIRLTGINIDITEHRRAEELQREVESRLHQSVKLEAIGRLAGGVAHDFNNLLMVISLSAQQIAEGLPQGTEEQEAIEAILEAGARGAALTKQLLAFGRKQVLKVEVVDVNAAVAKMSKMLGRLLGEDVACVVRLAPELPSIRADVTQLDQILVNLAVNARDAMPRGGTLRIETAAVAVAGPSPLFPEVQPGAYVGLTVADSGCGMDEVTRARIFEPFFTTKEPGRGTGLGLAMVYGVVKQFAGHIAVESTIGAGTTFTILFPAVGAERRTAADRAAPDAGRGTETILLVEDDPNVRKITTRLLEQRGYRVFAAADGEQALRLCEGIPALDLLVTDVVMPGMGGRAVAEALRARVPRLKVIFISGYNDDMVLRHGIEHEKEAFLQKPFTVEGLARLVRATLGGR